MIAVLKTTRANAIKFQTYNANELISNKNNYSIIK